MTYQTKDSGQRQEYESGMHRDTQKGKPRFDLIAPEDLPYQRQMLTRWAGLMERGAVKYGDRNWEKAKSAEERDRFRGSAFRHFMQWYSGEDDEDHGAAVFFNLAAAEYVHDKLTGKTEDSDDKENVPMIVVPTKRPLGFGTEIR